MSPACPTCGSVVADIVERARNDLLNDLVAMTRTRDLLAETADRLIAERDELREEVKRLRREYQDLLRTYNTENA